MRLFKRNYPALQKTVFVLIAFLGVTYIYYTWRSTEENKFDQTRLIARSFVASLPIDDLKVLEALPGDIDKPQYQVIKNALKELISINTTARFAYIFIERKGKIYFIADSEPKESKDYSPPGQKYSEFDLSFEQLFKDGKEYIKVHATDRWGTWTSVLVPVKDKVTGKTIAVFGMDFNAKSWFNSIFIEVTESSVLILLMLLTLVLLYLIKTKNEILNDNIAKLLQAADELKKQKEEFEMIYNLVPAQIWYKDTHNSFIRVNRQVCTDLGLTENEITGHSAEEIFPSFAQKYFDDDLEVFNSGKPKLDIIQQINTSAGELKWVHTDKFPVFGNDGELVGLVEFTQDITERKRSEEVLEFNNVILSTQLEASIEGILVVDKNANIISYNQRFVEMWGIPQEMVDNADDEPVLKFVMNKVVDPVTFLHRVQYLYEHKQEKSRDEIVLKNGLIFDRYSAPMIGLECQYYGRVWYFHDITELKQSEQLVRDNEKLFSAFFYQSPIGIALVDLQGCLIKSNISLSNIVGYSNDELAKMKFTDFTYPEDVDKELKLFTDLLEGKISEYKMVKRYIHKNGNLVWINLFVTLLHDENGNIQHILGMAEDISDRKLAELNLRETEHLLFQSQRLSRIGSWEWDMKGSFKWSNETYDIYGCLLYTSPSPRDGLLSRM